MRRRAFAAACLVLAACVMEAGRNQQTDVTGSTRVAIIPVVNLSGDEWKELLERQCQKGDAYLLEQFGGRGFHAVPAEQVKAAIETLKIDLADEEQHKRATLIQIGKAVEADLVVFAVITDTSQKLIQQLLSAKREGRAKVKLWLLDVRTEEPILSAKSVEGKSGGGSFAGLNKGSDRQVIAVANALRDGLKDFFKKYPELPEAKKK